MMAASSAMRLADCLYAKARAKAYLLLNALDRFAVKAAVRGGNHAAALISLTYFGLISMTSMAMPVRASAFVAAITAGVGPTSNAAFSQYFSTLVTPANFVFFIWCGNTLER